MRDGRGDIKCKSIFVIILYLPYDGVMRATWGGGWYCTPPTGVGASTVARVIVLRAMFSIFNEDNEEE